MANGNLRSPQSLESYTKVRGEITDAKGDGVILRASGEEVPAVKGVKLFLNDQVISYNDAVILVSIGSNGFLALGQNQQITLTDPFFARFDNLEEVELLQDVISIEDLEQAIAQGQSLEDILEAPAAGGDQANNQDGASSAVIFYQRSGDALIPISGFETTTFGRATEAFINAFGGDLDANNQLNSDANIVNSPPVANADQNETYEDSIVTGAVSDNDSDSDGTITSYTLIDDATIGTLTFNDNGSYTYDPDSAFDYLNAGESEELSFSYIATDDDTAISEPAVVTITINGVNDAPIASSNAITVAEQSVDTPLGLTAPSDTDGDALTITITGLSLLGVVTLANGNPVTNGQTLSSAELEGLQYDSPEDYDGVADPGDFTYSVSDGAETVNGAVDITVTPVNDLPIAIDDGINVAEDTAFNGNVSNNDTLSGDGGSLFSVESGDEPANGTIGMNTDGTFTYTPNPNFNGSDSFTYTLTDVDGDTSTAVVDITVTPFNDPPVVSSNTITVDEAIENTGLDLSAPTDIDGDSLTITVTGLPTLGEVTLADGSTVVDGQTLTPAQLEGLEYDAPADYDGVADPGDFTYEVNDGLETVAGSVNIVVNPLNNVPSIDAIDVATVSEEGLSNSIVEGNEDTLGNPTDISNATTFTGSYTISDADDDALTVTLSEPTDALSSGGVVITWSGSGTDTLVGSAGTEVVIELSIDDPIAGTGSYTMTLSAPLDHADGNGENLLAINVGLNVNDGTETTSDTLTVIVEDDSPLESAISENLNASTALVTTNLVLVVDTSGSMLGSLEDAIAALTNLINTADEAGNVNILITRFSGTAQSSPWFEDDVPGALEYLSSLTAAGGTQYDAALEEVVDSLGSGATSTIPTGDQTFIYFISDGIPNGGGAVSNGTYNGLAGVAGWEQYVTAADIDEVYSVGIPGATIGPLEDVSTANEEGAENAILLDTLDDLADTLLANFSEGAINGNLNDISVSGNTGSILGADGGFISQIVIGGVVYSYDPDTASAGDEAIFVDNTPLGGSLNVNFVTGNYEYSISVSTDLLGDQELLQVTSVDADGDSSMIDFAIDINFLPGLDANLDVLLTNATDGSPILIPEAALLWNDAHTDASITNVSNPVNGSVVSGSEIAFSAASAIFSSDEFETIAQASIEDEDVVDSGTSAINNNDRLNAVDLTDRSQFSSNDGNTGANVGGFSIQFSGSITNDGAADQDWLALQFAMGEDVTFDIDNATLNTDVFIYNDQGSLLTQISENSQGAFGEFTASYSGIYYALVQAADPANSGDYDLSVTIDPANANYDYGFDYTLTEASDTDTTSVQVNGVNNSTINGTDRDEILLGSDTVDTLNGLAGNDALVGNGGADILDGGDGSDILFGGQGADTLTGGADASSDTFAWSAGDGDSSIDTITDFSADDGGDVLDFSDLLVEEDANAVTLEDYLNITVVGANTEISVDTNGGAAGGNTNTVVLEGVDIAALAGTNNNVDMIHYLLINNNLNVDQ